MTEGFSQTRVASSFWESPVLVDCCGWLVRRGVTTLVLQLGQISFHTRDWMVSVPRGKVAVRFLAYPCRGAPAAAPRRRTGPRASLFYDWCLLLVRDMMMSRSTDRPADASEEPHAPVGRRQHPPEGIDFDRSIDQKDPNKSAPWKSSVSSSSFFRFAPVLECALLFPPAATVVWYGCM